VSWFQPLLYQCATGTLSIGQISRSLREELANRRNVTTLLGEAIRLDAQARSVTARRPDESTFDLDYDYLVIAAGMRQSYFGNEEFAAWAPGMKTLDDALSIRRRVFAAFEIAETLPPGPERDQWLTFVVTGAGPTGVELAGQIRERRPDRLPTSSTASNRRTHGCCCSTVATERSRASHRRLPRGRSGFSRSWAWSCTSACTSPTSGATA
jgi:NADH dehydrogenase FAD-containing subunit